MLVGTIGIGLFVLIIVWILALIIFVLGIKFQSNLAWVSLGVATSLMVVLLIIPLDKPEQSTKVENIAGKDYTFIYQIILLVFLMINAILAFIFFFISYSIEPIRAKPVKHF